MELVDWPWKLAVLADGFACPALKRSIASEWWESKLCNLDSYFSRRLRQTRLVLDWRHLLENPGWQAFLKTWSKEVKLTNAQVEFRNARLDRASANKSTQVNSFVAKSLHVETLQSHLLAERHA